MTLRPVHASYGLSEWQAVKRTFFVPVYNILLQMDTDSFTDSEVKSLYILKDRLYRNRMLSLLVPF